MTSTNTPTRPKPGTQRKQYSIIVGIIAALAIALTGCIPAPTNGEAAAVQTAMKQAGLQPRFCASSAGGEIYLYCDTPRGRYNTFKIERDKRGSIVRLRKYHRNSNNYSYFTAYVNKAGKLTGWSNRPR